MSRTIKTKGKWRKQIFPGIKNTGQRMKNAFIKAKTKTGKQIREQEPQTKVSPADYAQSAITGKVQITAKKTARQLNKYGKMAVKNLPKNVRTVKQTGKQVIKTAQKSIKTAGQSAKATAKTAQTTAKTAQKTTQATIKASRTVTKTAATTAKAIGKAIVAAVKAIVEIIIVGGWIAVVVILIIVLIAAVMLLFVNEDGAANIPSDFSFSSSYFDIFQP